MDDIYSAATTGGIHPDRVPSVFEMRQVMRGRLTDPVNDPGNDLGLETNHIVAQEWFKVLFQRRYGRLPTQTEIDETPGLIMPRIQHNAGQGQAGKSTFHDLLKNELPVRAAQASSRYTNAEILNALDRAYQGLDVQFGAAAEFSYSRVALVARRWLLNRHQIAP